VGNTTEAPVESQSTTTALSTTTSPPTTIKKPQCTKDDDCKGPEIVYRCKEKELVEIQALRLCEDGKCKVVGPETTLDRCTEKEICKDGMAKCIPIVTITWETFTQQTSTTTTIKATTFPNAFRTTTTLSKYIPCTDSDGGENPDELGTTKGMENTQLKTHQDVCLDQYYLMEGSCIVRGVSGETYIKITRHRCPLGCLEGACSKEPITTENSTNP